MLWRDIAMESRKVRGDRADNTEDIRKVERLWDDCPGGIRYYWQGNEDCEHKNDTVNEDIDIRSMNRE